MIKSLFAVIIGGSVGCTLRWLLSTRFNSLFPNLPPGTLVVNLLAGLIIGTALAVMLPTYWFSVWWCFWGAPVASVSISCPSCSATDGVVRNGKSTAGHQRYLCSHCRKTWQLQFTYTASQPGTHQKIIDMAMNGVGCRATARIMGVGLNTILRHLKNSGRSR